MTWYAALPRAEFDALIERVAKLRDEGFAMYDAYYAATARAEKAEAKARMWDVLHDALGVPSNHAAPFASVMRDLGCSEPPTESPLRMRFIYGDAPTDDDRRGEDGEAVEAARGRIP